MPINNESKWVDIEVTGEETGQVFRGRFNIKPFLTHKEKSDAVRLAERYYRGIFQNEEQRKFLSTVAFLHFHIIESDADWWKSASGDHGLDMVDQSPVWAISRKIWEIKNPEEAKKLKEMEEADMLAQEQQSQGEAINEQENN